jgi:imidazolonepropionase-like amidohydrolase
LDFGFKGDFMQKFKKSVYDDAKLAYSEYKVTEEYAGKLFAPLKSKIQNLKSKIRRFVLLLTTLAITAPLGAGQVKPSKEPAATAPVSRLLAIVGATVVDVNGKANIPDAVVLIEGNKIKSVGPRKRVRLPRGAQVIDARGKYVIPGLIDTHTHSAYDGKDSWPSSRFLAAGITTVLDTGSLGTVYELKRRIASGEIQGPRMLVCGPLITGEPAAFPIAETVKTPDEARRAVDAHVAAGADLIKTHAQLPPDALRAAVDEAHKKGLCTISHTGRTNALEAVLAGTNIITHLVGVPDAATPDPEKIRAAHSTAFVAGWIASSLAWLQVDQAKLDQLIREMVARRVAFSPTLSIHHTIAFVRDPDAFRAAAVASNPPEATLKEWDALAKQPLDTAPFKKAWINMQQFVKRFKSAGGMLIVGTDTAAVYQAPGLSAHEEMRLMVESGVTELDALRAGTINGARALGIDRETGSIQSGKLADIVIIDADPLADINNTRRITQVIKAGMTYEKTIKD